MSTSDIWDVVIVGAGPAGALAACLVARAGRSVLLLDRAAWPRSKVCGNVINGNAFANLRAANLAHVLDGAVRCDRFLLAVAGKFASIPLNGSHVLSREALDARLVRQAVDAGAIFRPATAARLDEANTNCSWRSLALAGDTHERAYARVVIAADGLAGGLLSDEATTTASVDSNSRIGAGTIVDCPADLYSTGTITMAVSRAGYVGLTRLEDGRLAIAAALDAAQVRRDHGLAKCVQAVIAAAGLPSLASLAFAIWKGTPQLTRCLARQSAYRAFAIGDAAGYIEPFTGEGIAWALASARLVAPIALAGVEGWHDRLVDQWTIAYRASVGRRQWLCRLLAWGLRRPRLVAAAAALGRAAPSAFAPIVRAIDRPTLLPA
ncbi:MAG: FAD-dependent monooxygenase [Gemmataceae bacterium]